MGGGGPAGGLLEQQTERNPKHHCQRNQGGDSQNPHRCVENMAGAFPCALGSLPKHIDGFSPWEPKGFL